MPETQAVERSIELFKSAGGRGGGVKAGMVDWAEVGVAMYGFFWVQYCGSTRLSVASVFCTKVIYSPKEVGRSVMSVNKIRAIILG